MLKRVTDTLTKGKGIAAGVVIAGTLFSGLALADSVVVQKDIRVSYLPLKFVFDGVQKAPPADQQGFTYNGRTYVPLRFLSEALGKTVEYDGSTYSIYIGRRNEPVPAIWNGYKTAGDASFNLEYAESGALTLTGQDMPKSLLVTSVALDTKDQQASEKTSNWSKEYMLDGQFKTLSGTLFVPVHYFGQVTDERKIGELAILNELNEVIYKSEVITTRSINIPFSVDIQQWQKVRVFLSLYHNQGIATGNELLATQIGISGFQLN